MVFPKQGVETLALGRCLKVHSPKGNLVLQLFNLEESSLSPGMQVWLFPLSDQSSLPPEGKSIVIESISFGPKVILALQGIADWATAEKLLPCELHLARKDLPQLSPETGEYYLADLMDLPVFEHSSGKRVGQVKGFYDNGAQMVLVIREELSGKEFDLPFLSAFFPVVDPVKGRIEVIVPEYLE